MYNTSSTLIVTDQNWHKLQYVDGVFTPRDGREVLTVNPEHLHGVLSCEKMTLYDAVQYFRNNEAQDLMFVCRNDVIIAMTDADSGTIDFLGLDVKHNAPLDETCYAVDMTHDFNATLADVYHNAQYVRHNAQKKYAWLLGSYYWGVDYDHDLIG